MVLPTSARDRTRLRDPSERSDAGTSPERRRVLGWPAGFIGAIGLILLLDGVFARIPAVVDPRSRLGASWQFALRVTEEPAAGAEILCFGDSQIKLGILPRILEARLGRTAYNLAVLGGQPPATHYLLRRVLERGQTPRALVVNFSPLLLGLDPRVNLEWWAGLVRGRERLEMILRSSDPALVIPLLLHGAISSLAGRDAARAALGFGASGPEGDEPRLADDGWKALLRNWTINRGAQLAPRAFVPIRGSLPAPYVGDGWRWQPHPIHAYYVARFLALARERRIPVYWIIPPAEAGWLERNEGVGTIGAYRRYVQGVLSRFPGLTVIDLQRAAWDRRWFRDPIHLNRDGAVRLSLAVADAIAMADDAGDAPGHWITLDGTGGETPPARPYQEGLEDLDQSRLAVSRGEDGPITMEGPNR